MKKVFLTIALAAFAFAANAQLIVGGNIGFNTFGGNTNNTNVAGTTTTEWAMPGDDITNINTTSLTLLPKVGYQLNDNMQVGASFGITWSKEVDYSMYAAEYATIKDFEGWQSTSQMGIQIAPYFRYNLTEFGNFTLFCEAQLAFTFGLNPTIHNYHVAYNNGLIDVPELDEDVEGFEMTSTGINLTVVPGLNYKLNDNLSLDLYINLLGLGFAYNSEKAFLDNEVLWGATPTPNTTETVYNTTQFYLMADASTRSINNLLNVVTIGFNYHF